ncbi:MAG: protein kinase domain-containing protein, partial [Acidobacteriota bacterium]
AYRIDASIGAGGMGEVYRAKDTRLGRDVAVKILPAAFATDPQRRARFEREARAVAALNHPNICTIHDVGHDQAIDFLVMELIDGEQLAARLTKGPLPLDEALARAIEIADALDTAHRHGIVHRDLKPGNVMLTKSASGKAHVPRAKLLDFGLARLVPPRIRTECLRAADTNPMTEAGAILGTLHYMAPEQIEGRPADARTDIFAFGTLLYQMLTGRRAFEGASTAALMAAILREEPPRVHPHEIGRIVRRCLAKDPLGRYQSARDLLNDLEEVKQVLGSGELETRGGERARSAHPRTRLVWAVAGAALMLAAVAGWGALTVRPADLPVVRSSLLAPEGTEFDFSEGAPALSPDGRRLAFLARGRDGIRQIWVSALDSPAVQALAGTEDATHPFWAPDGTALGFFSNLKLRRVDFSSGTIRPLCDVDQRALGGTWGPDGTILFARSESSEIYKVSSKGGSAVTATEFDASRKEATHRFPIFLPNGEFLMTADGGPEPGDPAGHFTLFVASLGSKVRKPITWADSSVAYSTSGHLLFLRGDTLFAQPFDASRLELAGDPVEISARAASSIFDEPTMTVARNGMLVYQTGLGELAQLAWMDRNGKLLPTAGPALPAWSVELSHDGRKAALVVTDPRPDRDIWVRDLEHGTTTKATFDPEDEFAPVWSLDDRHLFFTAGSTFTRSSIRSTTADGAGSPQTVYATPDGQVVGPTSLSSDGSVLATMVRKANVRVRRDLPDFPNDYDIGLLGLAGQAPDFPSRPESFELNGQFAPGTRSRWLAYGSNESGSLEVYVQRLDREQVRYKISAGGGTQPRWRRDGRELFYLSPELKLMAVEITLEPRFSMGIPRPLFEPKVRGFTPFQYDVAPDGQRFLILRAVTDRHVPSLTLIQNWTKELTSK